MADLFRQLWRDNLVGIEQQNPVVRERECVQGPLPFFWPTTFIIELNNLRSVCARDFDSFISALRIDYVDLTESESAQCCEAPWQVVRFVARRDDHADGQIACGRGIF